MIHIYNRWDLCEGISFNYIIQPGISLKLEDDTETGYYNSGE